MFGTINHHQQPSSGLEPRKGISLRRTGSVLLGLFTAALFLGAFGGDADAQRRKRKRKRKKAKKADVTPTSAQIAPSLGEIEWGWSQKRLVQHFRKKVHEEYRERIAKAPGAIEADEIRHERDQKVARIKGSYVKFTGRVTGHDSGFLSEEFTHRNGEAMFRVREGNSEDFYFFINNKLWKWYRAFDSSVFRGANWEQFSVALEGRFGKGRHREGKLHKHSRRNLKWLEWQDADTRARALDNNTFYGFYCLVFESKAALGQLDTLRTNRPRKRNKNHALVDSVLKNGEEPEQADSNRDIADRITGKINRRNNGGPRTTTPKKKKATPSSGNDLDLDDPLGGL